VTKRRRGVFFILLSALLAFSLVGCADNNQRSSGKAQARSKLSVLKIPADDWSYVADKKGWLTKAFKKYGIKQVKLVQGTLGNETQLLDRNELNVADRMIYPALLYKTQGADIKIVSVSKHPDSKIAAIIVPKNSPVKTFADLKGKKIASWRAGCPYMVLYEKAEKLNWKQGKDWKYVNIPSSDSKTALISKQVDAISAHPLGDIAALLADGQAREIANPDKDSVYVNGGGVTVNFTTTKFAKEHPDIIREYLKVQNSAQQWILNNKDEAAEIVQKVTRTPVKISKYSWSQIGSAWTYTSNDLSQIEEETTHLQDWLIKHNDIPKNKKIDVNSLFDPQFFKK
jgi:sulfonate transport system substrate-binding protein